MIDTQFYVLHRTFANISLELEKVEVLVPDGSGSRQHQLRIISRIGFHLPRAIRCVCLGVLAAPARTLYEAPMCAAAGALRGAGGVAHAALTRAH